MDPLPDDRFGVCIMDPPWHFKTRSAKGQGKSPSSHYPTMSIEEIMAMPLRSVLLPDAAVFMWTTGPHLALALDVLKALGLRYVTAGAWAKQSPTGRSWAFGTGYAMRSASEFFLLAAVGRPKIRSRSERNLIVAPRRRHSEKPMALHEKAERMYAGPYLELFARKLVPGWTVWGNEAPLVAAAERSS